MFEGNVADKSVGIFITNNSNVVFHNADMKFSNNKPLNNGGAFHIKNNSDVTFKRNCTIMIEGNQATFGGGVMFEGNPEAVINNNIAKRGGAIYIKDISNVVRI